VIANSAEPVCWTCLVFDVLLVLVGLLNQPDIIPRGAPMLAGIRN
jgi:hypothetical protein